MNKGRRTKGERASEREKNMKGVGVKKLTVRGKGKSEMSYWSKGPNGKRKEKNNTGKGKRGTERT